MTNFSKNKMLFLMVLAQLWGTAAAVDVMSGSGIRGAFSVDSAGGANYSIPLPSVGGQDDPMRSLSLNYNSGDRSGDALMTGWRITGMPPAIHICRRTIASDGIVRGIRLDGSDVWCINGHRLFAVSGSYGAPGTQYAGEFERHMRIVQGESYVSYSNATIIPFEVRTPNGAKLDFRTGYPPATQYLLSTPYGIMLRAMPWEIQGLSPAVRQRFEYTGLTNPAKIDFHPNFGDSSATYLRSVKFEGASDLLYSRFLAGSKIPGPVSIAGIGYYANEVSSTSPTKVITPSYESDPVSKIQRLTKITECNYDATRGGCLSPTQFTYSSTSAPAFGPTFQSEVVDAGQSAGRAWVDANGDGTADFCRVIGGATNSQLACTLSLGSSFGPTLTSGIIDAGANDGRGWFDFNGDGRADFCRVTSLVGDQGRVACTLMTTTGFGATVTSGVIWMGDAKTRNYADSNGDKRMDFCRYSSVTNMAACLLSAGGAFGVDYQLQSGPVATTIDTPTWIDVTADEQTEFCRTAIVSGSQKLICNLNNETNPTGSGISDWYPDTDYAGKDFGASSGRKFVDVNNDGLADFCRIVESVDTPGAYQLACQFAGGKGRFIIAPRNAYNPQDYEVRSSELDPGVPSTRIWKDLKGNGQADFCRVVTINGVNRFQCTLLRGAYFDSTITSEPITLPQETGQDLVDFTGDGFMDYCRVVGTTNSVDTRLACTPLVAKRNLLTKIHTTLGEEWLISYKPITDASVYTKDNDAVYPVRDVQKPLYVVSSVTHTTGPGLSNTTQYTYGGLKEDLTGRGSLGFRWMKATQIETGITDKTDFRQDFPYTGSPASQVRTTSSGAKLAQVTYTYGCRDPASVAACAIAPGKRYFPYLSQTVKSAWDLNGAALPTVTTTNQYDNFGNVTRQDQASSDGNVTTTLNTYNNDTSKWIIGQLIRSTVTTTTP